MIYDLAHRFAYHRPGPDKVAAHEAVRARCLELAEFLNANVPDGREKALAITHLEDTMMWSNASIARHRESEPEHG